MYNYYIITFKLALHTLILLCYVNFEFETTNNIICFVCYEQRREKFYLIFNRNNKTTSKETRQLHR